MNWEVVGAVAESVGALAVLLTLVYLAVQPRMARLAAEESTRFSVQLSAVSTMGLYSTFRLMANSPETAQVLAKAQSGQDLSDIEFQIFRNLFEQLFYSAAAAYIGARRSVHYHSGDSDVSLVSEMIRQYPRAVEIWKLTQPHLEEIGEFVPSVNARIERAGT